MKKYNYLNIKTIRSYSTVSPFLLRDEIKDLITGMVFSDACLEKGAKAKNARMKIKQKDREFVEHIYDQLKVLGLVKSPIREELAKFNDKIFSSYAFWTISHPIFTETHSH